MSCVDCFICGQTTYIMHEDVWYILYATPQYLECLNDSKTVSGNLPWTANLANVRQDVECERRVTYHNSSRII